MQHAIRQFRDSYADAFANGMSKFLSLYGQHITQRLHSHIAKPRSTIYIFGNGGSYSISKCMEYALQAYASSCQLSLRVETGVDIHKGTWLTNDGNPGMPFVRILETEGADSRDMVVLISGSGDSDNLCEVASYAKLLSIPTFAIIGSNRGKLREFVAPTSCFCVQLKDQQISEDIIQSLACFLDKPVLEVQHKDWCDIVSSKSKKLRQVIQNIPESFITAVAESLIESFYCQKFVWVLGLDNPTLSVCAEHTAHNLYWDSIYEVCNPPDRLIRSSPTASDFSGISNDRRNGLIPSLIGMNKVKGEGVALLYAMDASHRHVYEVIEWFEESQIPVFLISAKGDLTRRYQKVIHHKTGVKEPQIQAGISQAFGHILGRIVRMKILERQASHDFYSASNLSQFLMDFDLAQRRLLDD